MMTGNFHPLARVLRRGVPSLASFGLLLPFAALANPSGADVVHGDVTLSSPGAGGLVVHQNSHAAIINWQQFSIGDGEYVVFNQPSASAAVLNRVLGGNPSEILGDLSANGRVFLINPQGVMFGAGSHVDVGSLVVSTHDIADNDFLGGRYVFAGNSTAGIHNAGSIQAADGGFVVLAGDQVTNTGLIQARLGEVVLAAGNGARFELDTGGLVNFQVDAAAVSDAAGVENVGDIVAQGGNVLLTARVARDLAATAVNNSGRIVATAVEEQDGAIYLVAGGGNIENSGRLDVSGGDRGTVRVHGDRDITLHDGSTIDASGEDGGRVYAIAEGALLHAEQSIINVSATGNGDSGGFVELSGHGDIAIRGGVELGQNGHLLIDPTTLIVGDETSDSISFATLESLLQNNAGARIELIATNTIQIRGRTGAQTLNGRNENGQGAGLFLGIGSYGSGGSSAFSTDFVSFSQSSTYDSNFVRGTGGYISVGDSDDTLDIAGDIEMITGYDSGVEGEGQIDVQAALRAGGSVYLTAAESVTTGAITAGVEPRPTGNAAEGGDSSQGGGIIVSPTWAGYGDVSIYAGETVTTGAIDGNSLYVSTDYGDVNLQGAVTTDSYVSIYGGRSVTVGGAIDSGDSLTISAQGDGEYAGIQVDGAITAKNQIELNAWSGDIELVSATVTEGNGQTTLYGGVQLNVDAHDGRVDVSGNLSATAQNTTALVEVDGYYGVKIGGDVTAQGLGYGYMPSFDASFDGDDLLPLPGIFAADVDIYSDAGDVEVTGTIRATGLAHLETTDYIDSIYSRNSGHASVFVGGRQVTLGAIEATGTGDARVVLTSFGGEGTPANVTVGGPITIAADAMTEETSHESGASTSARYGVARLLVTAEGGEISTAGISMTGPSVAVLMEAGTLRLGAGEDGSALLARAATDDETRARFEQTELVVGETSSSLEQTVSSDFGQASVVLLATGGQNGPAIGIEGDVLVEGPSAILAMATGGDINVDGNLSVSGLGYTIEGDWSALSDVPYFAPETGLIYGFDPIFDYGRSSWGSGALIIQGYSLEDTEAGITAPPTGDVLVTGNISVDGIGHASATVAARSLDVEGAQGITITAGLGELSGGRYDDSGETSLLTEIGGQVDNDGNVTGTARQGTATFHFAGDGSADSRLDVANGVELSGGNARLAVTGARNVYLGGLALLGGRGEATPHYVQSVQDGGLTQILGGVTSADIDTGTDGGGIEITGDVTVEGTGVAALLLTGESVQLGNVSVVADSGTYANTNPAFVTDDIGFGDATVYLSAHGDAPVTATSLTAVAANDLHLGVVLDATGDVTLEAGGSIDNTIPGAQLAFPGTQLAFMHPLYQAEPTEIPEDLEMPAADISANDITVSFTQSPDLANLSLAANGTLTLDGNGSTLNISDLLNLSGDNLSLIDVAITATNLELGAAGTLSIAGSTLNYDSGSFEAAQIDITEQSELRGTTHTLTATSGISIDNSYVGGQEGNATTITLNAPLVEVLNGAQLDADTLDLDGNTLNVSGSTLNGSLTADFTDSISLTESTLDGGTATLTQSGGQNSNGGGISIVDSSLTYSESLTVDAAGPVSLSGDLTAAQMYLESGGALNVRSEGELLIDAGALDVIAEVIDLRGSTLEIGTGTAVHGHDTALLDRVLEESSSLAPSSEKPNATFIATGAAGVSLGTITIEGGYLFVKAATISAEQIGAPERLFFNYRPFDDEADIEVPQTSLFDIDAPATTLAIGGSGYQGDITVLRPPQAAAKATETYDYVFLTGGTVFNPSTINTSGQVLVLGGTIVNPPVEEHDSPAEMAADVQAIVSNLPSELDPDGNEVAFETDLIEEESSAAAIVEEFQCR